MTSLSIPVTLVAGANENVNDIVTNFNAIATWGNGNIDSTNIATSGVATANIAALAVTDAKIASANNSVYKTLLTTDTTIITDQIAGTYGLGSSLITSAATNLASAATHLPIIYFDDADYTVASKTQKLRLRFQVSNNGTAWSTVTATAGLYPVTFSGGADTLTPTLGTVVSGSTVALANPGASTTSQGNSGDFTIPADGMYCVGVVTSATLTNNAASLLSAQLQTRHI